MNDLLKIGALSVSLENGSIAMMNKAISDIRAKAKLIPMTVENVQLLTKNRTEINKMAKELQGLVDEAIQPVIDKVTEIAEPIFAIAKQAEQIAEEYEEEVLSINNQAKEAKAQEIYSALVLERFTDPDTGEVKEGVPQFNEVYENSLKNKSKADLMLIFLKRIEDAITPEDTSKVAIFYVQGEKEIRKARAALISARIAFEEQ